MKILFLDIDGVLNCKTTRVLFDCFLGVEPKKVQFLQRIKAITNCQVVLSSTWRHHDKSVYYIEENVCHLFSLTGDDQYGHRGTEIKEWIEKWDYGTSNNKVDKYAILDDDSDMLPEQLPSFFQTSFETGLTEEITQKIIKHLL